MKPHVLIITEDVVKIQTLTGFLGRLYSRVYIGWIRIRLALGLLILRPFFRASVLASGADKISYGDELARVNYSKNRKLYWQVANRLAGNFPFKHKTVKLTDLFVNRLTNYLAYHYFVYAEVYINLINRLHPDRVVLLGNSCHEQIAGFIGRRQQLPVTVFSLGSFSWLQQWLQQWLLNREYGLKINSFLRPTGTKMLPPVKGTWLSVDFYRHLKTLIPLYRKLEAEGKKPTLITDVANLLPTLKSLYFEKSNLVNLPYQLTATAQRQNSFWQNRFNSMNFDKLKNNRSELSLTDFFYNLSLESAEAMIRKSLFLSRLYLQAADNLFKHRRPKGVIVVSDLRFAELALARLAKVYRVPSILVSPNTMMDLASINLYRSTDKIAVVGEYIKSQLQTIGIPESKIKIVGDLVKENINQKHFFINKKRVDSLLGIEGQRKIILVISFRPTWMIPKEEKKAFVMAAIAGIRQVPGAVPVIKPHPTEKRYRVLEELQDWGIKDVIVSDNDQVSLLDLIHASSAVVQTWSFTIFEAIMLNRPVLVVNPFSKNYHNFLPIIKPSGVKEAKNATEIKQWLKILINPKNKKTITYLKRVKIASEKFIHFSDGEASGKVITWLFGNRLRSKSGGKRR